MEYLNKVELAGKVGVVRKNDFGCSRVATFSLCIESLCKNSDGTSIIETTWINVVAWDGSNIDFDSIEKGANLKIEGRLRTTRYSSAEGKDVLYQEVIAHSVRMVSKD